MFNISPFRIINSSKNDKGKDIFNVLTDSSGSKQLQIKGHGSFETSVTINGVAQQVLSITRKAYTLPVVPKSTIDVASILANGVGVYTIETLIRLSTDDNDSIYANDLTYKGRTFISQVSINATDITAGVVGIAEKISKVLNKAYHLGEDSKFFTTSVDSTGNPGIITFEGTTEYQIFEDIKILYANPSGFDNIELDSKLTIVNQSKTGFGTFNWLQSNITVPNWQRIRLGANRTDELPIPGANYDQYVFKYRAYRPELGSGNLVGAHEQVTVSTHTFYVLNTGDAGTKLAPKPTPAGASADLSTVISTAGASFTELETY